jgi:ribosomal protein S18 acetylase RimI-like enzyme
MALKFRPARPAEFPDLERMVIEAFEPITWMKKLDERIGPLNGQDWRARWRRRMQPVFQSQAILVGEENGEVVAFASAAIDADAALGLIDLLAVRQGRQGQGVGRQMLRAMMAHLKQQGCRYVNLECLTDNAAGNALYASEGFTEVARQIRWFREL